MNEIGYCSVTDLRDRGITIDMAADAEIEKSIRIATMFINLFCNRDFWLRDKRYYLDGSGTNVLFLDDRPIISISELKADGIELASSEYKVYAEPGYIKLVGLYPVPGKNIKGLFPKGEQNIEVYGQFGFEVIPDEVKEACILLSIDILGELKTEIKLTKTTTGSSIENAIGLKRAKIEDISVEFEYPKDISPESRKRTSTGNSKVDSMLLKFKKDMEAIVV